MDNEALKRLFGESTTDQIDLIAAKLNKDNLMCIEKLLKGNSKITVIKFEDNLVHVDDESRTIFANIQKHLVENILSKNNTVTDLSDFDINAKMLEIVEKSVKVQSNIGIIKWNETSKKKMNDDCKRRMEQIERQLIVNNEEFRRYPSDFVHCLLANLTYTLTSNDATLGTSNLCEICCEMSTNEEIKENYQAKQRILGEWKVREKFERKAYKSILFENTKRKQLVLSFRGAHLEVADFFLSESQICTEVNSMLGNLEIAPQTVYAYLDTHAAVELSNSLGYSLSFTGYAFGAWLAEQCVFFCHRDFQKKRDDVRGVTFDSPGSLEYLEKLNTTNILGTSLDLTHLDVVQYVSEFC